MIRLIKHLLGIHPQPFDHDRYHFTDGNPRALTPGPCCWTECGEIGPYVLAGERYCLTHVWIRRRYYLQDMQREYAKNIVDLETAFEQSLNNPVGEAKSAPDP